ncbi:MAG: hypothetical protein C0618_11995 [Desulfuromonas sp.]|nr:MAG: hypothetical protein C0618_11995 [Desulfuromonas sp.]
MMFRVLLTLVVVVLFVGSASARTLSLGFNDETAQVVYEQLLTREAYGDSDMRARLWYDEESEIFLGSAGVGVNGSPGNIPGFKTGIKVMANGYDKNSVSLLAVSLGLLADYTPPFLQGFGATAEVHYSPSVFTFLDAKDYLETGVSIRYALMPKAALMLSYQNILVDYEDFGDVRLDDTVRIGVRIDF